MEQSEKNLKAQYDVTLQEEQLKSEAIKQAKWELLQLLAKDTAIDFDEMEPDKMETVIHPMIKSCTKDSIGSGKGWIFQNAISHNNNKLVAHYLAYRITQDDASFTLKLHLI